MGRLSNYAREKSFSKEYHENNPMRMIRNWLKKSRASKLKRRARKLQAKKRMTFLQSD
jgi:hypothetical protein